MLRLLEQARLVAQSDVSGLINGQSSTRKDFRPGYHNANPPQAICTNDCNITRASAGSGCWVMRAHLLAVSKSRSLFPRRKAVHYFSMIGDMPALRYSQASARARSTTPAGRNRDNDIDVRIFCDPPRPPSDDAQDSAKPLLPPQRCQPEISAPGQAHEDIPYWQNTCCQAARAT